MATAKKPARAAATPAKKTAAAKPAAKSTKAAAAPALKPVKETFTKAGLAQHLHAVHGGQQHGLGTTAGKQPHRDDARPLVDGLFEGDRIMDLQARDVQDGVRCLRGVTEAREQRCAAHRQMDAVQHRLLRRGGGG